MIEDNTFVIKGPPPLVPIPDISVGKFLYDKLLTISSGNEALVEASTGQSLSYKELLGKTCSLAESLRRAGYGQNTMFAISSENCVEFFIPIIAVMYIGATVAPISHNYTIDETIHALNISKPNIIFCSQEVCSKYVDLKKNLKFIEKLIIVDNPLKNYGIESMDAFITRYLGTSELLYTFNFSEIDAGNHVALILYSSGTTGLPKGVMITHRNVITKFMHSLDPRLASQKEGRCTFAFLPLFHAYGLFICLISIYKEVKIVVMKRFEENLFLSIIEKYRITVLTLVPPLAVFLAKSPLVNKYDLSSVVDVGCGAAPLSKEVEEAVKKRLNLSTIKQGYGLTEATLAVISIPMDSEKHGSVGKLYPYMLCKVRDPETGRSLGPNQVGELCFKGPLVMKGYYCNEESTKNSFTSDGWLLTGDLGYYDEEEFFYIVGRLKELIKYKGFQVAPAELEAILLTNPKIKDAAVIGLPNEEAGELPLAFIVKNPSSNITEEEVEIFLADKVSSPKRLRGGVIFVQEIPKNASGKILRGQLKNLLHKYKSKLSFHFKFKYLLKEMKEDNTFVIKGPPPLGPIPEISVGKLIYDRLLSQFNENDALVDAVTEKSISYKEILERTCALAESLIESGYGKQSIITICSENCIEFFIPVIAALYIGAIVAPVSHNYTRNELLHALSISRPNVIFCSEQTLPKFLDLKKTLTNIEKIIVINSESKDDFIESMDGFIDRSLNRRPTLYRFNIQEIRSTDEVAVILCSSGTTGLPKGVMVTHKNILTKFIHNEDSRLSSQEKGRCTFGVLPFFHSYGMFISLNSIYKGIKIIVVNKFEEHLFLRTIEKYKITSLSLVPSLALFLAKTPLVDKYDISSVVEVSCGAAPLSKNTEEILKNKLKIRCVQQAYGLTETTLCVVGLPPGEERFGSSGKLLPYMLAKVRDSVTGKSFGPNQVGELCFKGPLIAKGYYRNEEATKSSFTPDGWFLTGDLGYYDQEEYFFVVDRLKELIKYKRYQIGCVLFYKFNAVLKICVLRWYQLN